MTELVLTIAGAAIVIVLSLIGVACLAVLALLGPQILVDFWQWLRDDA